MLKQPWIRLIIRNIEKRSFYTSKTNALFYESPDKDGYAQKSKEQEDWEKWSFKKRLVTEYQLYKEGIKEWYAEKKEAIIAGPDLLPPGEHEVDVIWRFTGDKSELKHWVISSDKDYNFGTSTGQLNFTRNSKGIFHGFLDTKVPVDGQLKRTGYCNLRLIPRFTPFKNKKPYDWSLYTHLVLRIRGEGRVYAVNLHLHRHYDVTSYDTHHYFIWTRGGPYWQHVRIPFSKFFFAYKGRIQSSNLDLTKDTISTVSFTLADKITGPFHLEIDYIGVESDLSHIEENAYEQYHFDQKIW